MSNKQNARDYLLDLLDDYRNNYLTIEKFAEHNGLHSGEARELIALAVNIASHDHPEA
jgi:hypothetical protein